MPLGSLWLSVVVSTVAVFLVSAALHMALEYHNADYKKLPDEDAVGETLRKHPLPPGLYMIPHGMHGSAMKDPAFLKKFEAGPVALIAVLRNGPPKLGQHLAQWFALVFLISFTAAYVARHTLMVGADGLLVMRVTGSVALAGYGYGFFHDSIWKGSPWANSIRGLVDSVVYAVVTALVFRWLWPAA